MEKILKSPLDCRENKPVSPKGNQSWIFTGRTDAEWSSNTLATWCKEQTHWKRPWGWERLKAGGEGDDRGWDDWMESLTQWTWDWASSGTWWWTGKADVLQSMESQSIRRDWATELNWYYMFTLVTLTLPWLLVAIHSCVDCLFPLWHCAWPPDLLWPKRH